MDNIVLLEIDGRLIKAKKEETILEAAIRNGIEIPNLCYNKKVSHTASCRLCIVNIEGRPGGIPSCTTPVEEGMKVKCFTPELEKIRKTILDLALSNHNDDCISCEKDGKCELQDLAFRYSLGKKERRFPPIWEELNKTSDFSNNVLNYDASKCIQCKRCIKACLEIQGKGVLTFANRGIRTSVTTGYRQSNESKCDGCGECAQICPCGAITVKQFYGSVKRIRYKDLEKKVITTCPYCGVGCQLNIFTKTWFYDDIIGEDRILAVTGADSIPNNGSTCVKGRFGLDFITRKDRLVKPLIRKDGKLTEVEWKEALEYTARKFLEIKNNHGAGAIAGLSSARCTNEENYLFQKFIRTVIGSPNVDHCARLCHASTVAGLAITLGSGAMTNSIQELENAEVILVTGSNTTETHPVISTFIKRAVLNNKARLIVVDPREIDLCRYATLWLRQRNGTDIAWINGMVQYIISNGLENKVFIENHTENFKDTCKVMAKYDAKTVEDITGIPAEKLEEAARLYATAKTASIVYSMGITQHAHGTDNVKALSNLALVTGQIGRESTGINPLRGQNNVQGACDMGALPNVLPGYQKIDDSKITEKFEKVWGVSFPDKIGLTVTEIINGAHSKNIRGIYIMGENPMVSDPDINHVKESLTNLDFLVVQDIFLTETAELADVVFPAALFAEKDGTFTNTERRVLPIRKVVKSPGDALADWRIIQDLAKEIGHNWKYESVDDILHEINILVPQYGGITSKRLKDGELLQWPCPSEEHPGTKFLHKDGNFTRGKGLFSAVDHIDPKEMPSKEYPYILNTGRILYHYHTNSMTGRTVSLPRYVNEAYVEINNEDCVKLNVDHGDKVRINSRRGSIDITVRKTDIVATGSVFIPFHFADAAANVLTNSAIDPIAKIPELKVCAVAVEKIE